MLRCWQVRVWDVQSNGTSIPKAAITLEKPPLCSAWSADGSVVFAGGCDSQACLQATQPVLLLHAAHMLWEAPSAHVNA